MRQPGEKIKVPIDIYFYWKKSYSRESPFSTARRARSLIPLEGLEMKQSKTSNKCEYVKIRCNVMTARMQTVVIVHRISLKPSDNQRY